MRPRYFSALKWNIKSQSAPVNFTFVPLDQSYPVCKRKKENLDLYLPDGALKINWMVKQLEQIPAVLCFFVDLEFNDPNMGNRLQEIKSKLDILRQSLENRKWSRLDFPKTGLWHTEMYRNVVNQKKKNDNICMFVTKWSRW